MIYRFTEGAGVELEERAEGTPRIVGYAARFWNGDKGTEFVLARDRKSGRPLAVERIMPGAFSAAIKRDDVRALFNHDPNMILGRTKSGTLELEETTRGLRYRVTPNPEKPTTISIIADIRRGDIDGSSFGFALAESDQSWRVDGGIEVREIRDVSVLADVSPVTYPAYTATSAGIRSSGGPEEWEEFRDAWRRSTKAAVDAEMEMYRARAIVAGMDVA